VCVWSCVMGNGGRTRCFNAPHAWQLGWGRPKEDQVGGSAVRWRATPSSGGGGLQGQGQGSSCGEPRHSYSLPAHVGGGP
jgi:hypothetical protein